MKNSIFILISVHLFKINNLNYVSIKFILKFEFYLRKFFARLCDRDRTGAEGAKFIFLIDTFFFFGAGAPTLSAATISSNLACTNKITAFLASSVVTLSVQWMRSGSTVVPLWKGAFCTKKGSPFYNRMLVSYIIPASTAKYSGTTCCSSYMFTSCPSCTNFSANSYRWYKIAQCKWERPFLSTKSSRSMCVSALSIMAVNALMFAN